jgi:ring-1,2-phenylacetyl-CoA epoxidase subunit PaaC
MDERRQGVAAMQASDGGTGAAAAAIHSPLAADASALFEYLLRLADTDLILAQRLGERVGKGPVLEEDIAQTNVGLDLLGQARLWYGYAAEVESRWRGTGRSEDELAFLRDGGDFRNLLLVEQPNGSYADTTARQFYFDCWHLLLLGALASSRDSRIAEIAAKARKEAAYHVERSTDWVVRLGDGTDLSHARMQAALDDLWVYTGEMFEPDAVELALADAGIAADVRALRDPWLAQIRLACDEATLRVPEGTWMQGANGRCGKQGVHTEHLGHLLAEMQFLQRAYPGAQW